MGLQVQNWHVDTREKSYLFCYLVPDTALRGMMTEYNLRWADRVDVRPFGDFGITLAPINNISQPHTIPRVQLEVKIHMSYIVWNDPPPERPVIAPVLHPQMPGILNFVQTPF